MKLICIMGGSKSGKSTVEKKLKSLGFKPSISYTTRGINTHGHTGEVNGVDYHFVNREQFNQLIKDGKLLEHVEIYGNLYGTPRLYGSSRYVAVVELQGYKVLRDTYKGQVLGVLLTANSETIEERSKICSDDFFGSEEAKERFLKDKEMVEEMAKEADIIIDSTIGIDKITAKILKEASIRLGGN